MASPALLYQQRSFVKRFGFRQFPHVRIAIVWSIGIVLSGLVTCLPSQLLAQENSSVQFDVPALVSASAWEITANDDPDSTEPVSAETKGLNQRKVRTVTAKPTVPAVFARQYRYELDR